MFDFLKVPKKSYAIKNSDFNQLDFPIKYRMFISAHYQFVENFKDNEEYKKLKLRFHAVLGKNEE